MSSNPGSNLSSNLSRNTQDSKWTTNQEELQKRITEPPRIDNLETLLDKVNLTESKL